MSENIPNLDSRCAQFGYDLVKAVAPNDSLPKGDKAKLENTITKSLGVLQENGVYAFFLYLEYRLKELGAEQMKSRSLGLLRHADVSLLAQNNDHFVAVRQLTENLDSLLLARQLIEQTLIYARYHAKALRET
ncbi:MAG: hypothetical protein DPW09_03115 [Anaerolineae bacterium]|nr:hypothetical protein [Anaerolineae bacterium]